LVFQVAHGDRIQFLDDLGTVTDLEVFADPTAAVLLLSAAPPQVVTRFVLCWLRYISNVDVALEDAQKI
jgi:hypothetical protein